MALHTFREGSHIYFADGKRVAVTHRGVWALYSDTQKVGEAKSEVDAVLYVVEGAVPLDFEKLRKFYYMDDVEAGWDALDLGDF